MTYKRLCLPAANDYNIGLCDYCGYGETETVAIDRRTYFNIPWDSSVSLGLLNLALFIVKCRISKEIKVKAVESYRGEKNK